MDPTKPNGQYNVADPNSLAIRVADRQRRKMYHRFLEVSGVEPADTILDVGATSDTTYSSSNYLEAWYPHKDKLVASGLDDAQFLEHLYPGMRFVRADGLDLPFPDRSFDVVHSSAVLEHVGSSANQIRFVEQCTRVARRSIFLTTPNRWFPVEFHTSLPLLHWLPKRIFRSILARTRLRFFAQEANLNLLSYTELDRIGRSVPGWRFSVVRVRLGWLTTNMVLAGERYGD